MATAYRKRIRFLEEGRNPPTEWDLTALRQDIEQRRQADTKRQDEMIRKSEKNFRRRQANRLATVRLLGQIGVVSLTAVLEDTTMRGLPSNPTFNFGRAKYLGSHRLLSIFESLYKGT